jgi:hypothetical protein
VLTTPESCVAFAFNLPVPALAGMTKPPRHPPPQKRKAGLVDEKVESRAVVPRKRNPRQAGLLDGRAGKASLNGGVVER